MIVMSNNSLHIKNNYRKEVFIMEGTTIATLLTSAVEVMTTAVGSVWQLIISNPLASLFVGLSVIGCGIGLFSSIKQAV